MGPPACAFRLGLDVSCTTKGEEKLVPRSWSVSELTALRPRQVWRARTVVRRPRITVRFFYPSLESSPSDRPSSCRSRYLPTSIPIALIRAASLSSSRARKNTSRSERITSSG